jgi:hypothetical protein
MCTQQRGLFPFRGPVGSGGLTLLLADGDVASGTGSPREVPHPQLAAWQGAGDLEAGGPVEAAANVRDHSPGCTMARHGKRRVDRVRKSVSGRARRIGLGRVT